MRAVTPSSSLVFGLPPLSKIAFTVSTSPFEAAVKS